MSRESKEKHRERMRKFRRDNADRAKAINKAWRENNPEKVAAQKRAYKLAKPEKHREHNRISHLRVKYGLTIEQYDYMLKLQCGVCAICRGDQVSGKRLAIDHDHSTGRIRGLLCNSCNMSLARFELHPELATERVCAYLGGDIAEINKGADL